jgi:hypothetical protein
LHVFINHNEKMETNIENKNFNHEEGFKIIYQMIESAKSTVGKNYKYYLIWGYLVIISCVAEYLLIALAHYKYHYMIWPVLMLLGCILTVILVLHQRKLNRVKSYIGSFMSYLWGGWFVSLVILLVFVNLKHDYNLIIPLVLAMFGLAIFVSGGIVSFRPLLIGGILAWSASILTFFMPYLTQLVVMAAVVIISYIIPGYILKTVSIKSENHVS